jgi:hypothetical protein
MHIYQLNYMHNFWAENFRDPKFCQRCYLLMVYNYEMKKPAVYCNMDC